MMTFAGLVAARATALTLDQYGVHLKGKPGEMIRGAIKLTNDRAHPVVFDVGTFDLSAPRGTLWPWLVLGRSEIAIAGGATTQMEYTVSIPTNAAGQLLSRVSFTERPASTQAGAVSFLSRMSIHIAATIVGTEVYAGAVTGLEVVGRPTPLIRFRFRNDGNVYLKPSGPCVIRDAATGERVARTIVNRVGEAVHVGRTEPLIGALSPALAPGEYAAEVSLKYAEALLVNETFRFTVSGETP